MMPDKLVIFGLTFPLYYVGYLIAFPLCALFNFFYYRKCYNIGNLKVIVFTMMFINLGYFGMLLSSYIFTNLVAHGIYWVRVVGFMPLLWILIALLSHTKINVFLDFMTPSAGITNVCVHTCCIFAGCCHGFPIEQYPVWLQWMGIYNNETASYLFPVQLVEVATIAVITVGLVLWARHKHFRTNGQIYPIFLILYSATRFVWEFFRDNDKIVSGLSEFNFWCIGWVVEGIIWLIMLHIINGRHVTEIPREPDDISPPSDFSNSAVQEGEISLGSSNPCVIESEEV